MARVGLLLIQLGTPDAPTPEAVRRYLSEFLGDPRVIEGSRWAWWVVRNFRILPARSRESAAKYARIWDERTGSPLLHFTRLQAAGLVQLLPDRYVVRFGMRYGNPSIDSAVQELLDAGADRLIALPLYPQYSAASTGTACDHLFRTLERQRHMPALRVVPPFYSDPRYIAAQAGLVRAELARMERPPDKIVLSFHGYPIDYIHRGDPYRAHVEATARLLAAELALGGDGWLLTYQSRFGRQAWLEPYTEEMLRELAQRGVRRVLVASPGFTADCLETIDEIGREAADAFRRAGGEQLVRCPCLNDDPVWLRALADMVLDESQGWIDHNGRAR